VLDSPLPIGIRRLEQFAELETEPAEHLFAWCAADAACDRAYPDLEQRTLDLVEALNKKPLRVASDEAAQAGLRGGFDGNALVRLLTSSLPSNPLIAGAIPRAIADLEDGNATVAMALLAGTYPPPVKRDIPPSLTDTTFETLRSPTDARLALSLAMRTFVLCNDEAGAVTLDDIAKSAENAPLSALRTQTPYRSSVTLFAQCQALKVDTEPLSIDPPTASIPTLVLSGDYDATTAPSWAKEAADALPDATLVSVPSAGHATTRWSACARDIASAFVDNPTATLDTGCLAGEEPELLGPNDPLA
jgi:hypothetical protein